MGRSPDAKLGWGIDLGHEEEWGRGKYVALGSRFEPDYEDDEGVDSFLDWEDSTLPNLFIDKTERDARFEALHAAFDAGPKSQEERTQYMADRAAIEAEYPLPVVVATYGYEFGAHALVLSRSYSRASDYGSVTVDPVSITPPTEEEIGHLRQAIESLGLTFDPADVELILMSQYG